MITQFTCWKNTDKSNDKSPDYRLSVKINDKWVECGAGWLKKAGEKTYIAFSLSKSFQGRPGWELTPIFPEEKVRTPDERIAESDRGIRNEEITFEQPHDSDEEFNNYGKE